MALLYVRGQLVIRLFLLVIVLLLLLLLAWFAVPLCLLLPAVLLLQLQQLMLGQVAADVWLYCWCIRVHLLLQVWQRAFWVFLSW